MNTEIMKRELEARGHTVAVFSRRHQRVEHIPVSTHQRLQRLFTALKDGLAVSPGVTWWSSLAPLTPKQRAWLLEEELPRLRAMSPEEQSAELLLIQAEGDLR